MNDSLAFAHADKLIALAMTHQPGFLPTGTLLNSTNATNTAMQLAQLRQTLIQELKKQPG